MELLKIISLVALLGIGLWSLYQIVVYLFGPPLKKSTGSTESPRKGFSFLKNTSGNFLAVLGIDLLVLIVIGGIMSAINKSDVFWEGLMTWSFWTAQLVIVLGAYIFDSATDKSIKSFAKFATTMGAVALLIFAFIPEETWLYKLANSDQEIRETTVPQSITYRASTNEWTKVETGGRPARYDAYGYFMVRKSPNEMPFILGERNLDWGKVNTVEIKLINPAGNTDPRIEFFFGYIK